LNPALSGHTYGHFGTFTGQPGKVMASWRISEQSPVKDLYICALKIYMMKLLQLRALPIALALLLSLSLSAQMGVGTNSPDSSAMLDIFSPNKGLLIPRVALTAANQAGPVNNPATGLLVYNTATAGTAPNNVVPGFYFWTGSRWYPAVNRGNSPGEMQYWNGTQWVAIPAGTANGQTLTWCNGRPQWGECITSPVTLKPANNPYEGHISDFVSNAWYYGADQLPIATWTSGGTPGSIRVLLRFDYTTLPAGAIIDSARLYLYADPTPLNGNLVDAHFGPANAFSIQRITSNWALPTTFSWNNPPVVATANQVTIPQSTSSFQDCVADVTQLVKDQVANGNNGFMMKLVAENYYNSRQYISSKNTDVAKHPRLVIYFH
jgi:hypothetical protein